MFGAAQIQMCFHPEGVERTEQAGLGFLLDRATGFVAPRAARQRARSRMALEPPPRIRWHKKCRGTSSLNSGGSVEIPRPSCTPW